MRKEGKDMKKLISAVLAATMLGGMAVMPVSAQELTIAPAPQTQTKAFPEAEGGGMYAKGARAAQDMEVYHVTNLNDSGEGSFRDAVSRSGRFVVFDVSGMIDLKSRVTVHSNITIMGQTAPGDGICLRGNSVKINGSDIIVRNIRFRVGAHLADGSDTMTQDGLEIADNSERVIIDHCSVSWGTDENLSAYAIKDVTIQNSIVAEALNQSIHSKGEHSYAAIWGGVNLTVHHNIIASHKSRNPKIGTSETVAMTAGYKDSETLVDIRNNIFYNWGDKAGYGAENGANVNIINNYYKPGPATPAEKRARIFEFSPGNKYQKGWSGAVYANGNYIADNGADAKAVNADNWQIERGSGIYLGAGVEKYEKLEAPNETYINDYPITTTDAQEAYEYVMANAGARLPKLDIVDERILADVANGTGQTGSKGSVGLVDDPRDTVPTDSADKYDDRGYPIWESETRAADYDSDKDGIPDSAEDAMGLDKTNPTDSLITAPEGYTYLEMYANGTESTGAVDVEVSGTKATVSAAQSGNYDVYIDGEKVKTVELNADIPTGAVLVSAGYDADGRLVEMKSATDAFAAVEGEKVKHFVWNGLDKMQPLDVNATAEIELSEYDVATGAHTVTAVSEDKSAYSVDYMYKQPRIEGETKLSTDFTAVINAEVPTTAKNAYSVIKLTNGANEYRFGVGSNAEFAKTLYNNGAETALGKAKIVKVEKKGAKIALYTGETLFDNSLVAEYDASAAETTIELETVSENGADYAANMTVNVIQAKSEPQIEIVGVEENQRLGFNERLKVKAVPDGAAIAQIEVLFKGKSIALEDVDISEAQEIEIPIAFEGIDAGELMVRCVDANLCIASDSVNISVSGELAPWQIADIGLTDAEVKTYANVTNDYTYKINAPEGAIGGKSDKFGYVYQLFSGDNRLYYRSRMQGGAQFGVMLRASLDADAEMYWFGGEYVDGTLKYQLRHRAADGTDSVDFSMDGGANMYFIAEKAGNKFNIYQTENSSTVYTTKTPVCSIETGIDTDSYYMGFAAVGKDRTNPSDSGWVSIDNNSGDNTYTWNFENGLDWYWQLQEQNVLAPSWTTDEVGGNVSGKMVIEPNADYMSERYIFREYQMSDSLVPELNADVMVTGEKPAMNVYFQTGKTGEAYKAVIEDGKLLVNGAELCNIDAAKWYRLNIKEDTTADGSKTALITVYADNVWVAENEITAVTGTEFREQKNTAKKTSITKAVYFEPKAASEGKYYVDNVTVTGNEPSVKVTKVTTWYTFKQFAGMTQADATAAMPIAINGTSEPEGETVNGEAAKLLSYASYSGGVVNTKYETKTTNIEDGAFTGYLRLGKSNDQIEVPVKKGSVITVYAASASSSETRNLMVNGTEMPFSAKAAASYTYDGEDGTVLIYPAKGINLYGIKVSLTTVEQ